MDLKFEYEGFWYEGLKYDKKQNLLYVKKYNLEKKFICNDKLKTGILPKKIKQRLNPLK